MTDCSNSDITVPDVFILYCVFFYHILYPINSDILKNTLNYLCCFIYFFELTICYKIIFHVFFFTWQAVRTEPAPTYGLS